ncbi:PEP-CTERM sorting domain-containing protein [Azohydromonas aeria]|uniref:PEP-CTERM sorting domain-containing protein n=1 Tax=Azohydromonas aeria TaxID=2590212 RepID=UPI0012F844CA|nr:PEP-CTERM sorting domain-containing protein [Azohydromonas aeria]
MKMNFKAMAAAAFVAAGVAVPVQAATLTFQSQPVGLFGSLAESGFVLTHDPLDGSMQPEVADVGGNHVLVDSTPFDWFGSGFTLRRQDGGAFNLHSVDVLNLDGLFYNPIFKVFVGPSQASWTELTPNFGTVAINMVNVTSAFFGIVSHAPWGLNYALDNIVATPVNVSAVPEPSTLALLVLPVLGLAGRARRRHHRPA